MCITFPLVTQEYTLADAVGYFIPISFMVIKGRDQCFLGIGKSLGKGQDFADDFTNTLYKVLANPETYRKVHDEYRRVQFDKFPYYVVYKQRPKTIHIIAVFHNKRNDTWKKRLH